MYALLNDIQEATRARDDESRRELLQERTKMEAIIRRLENDSANNARSYGDILKNMEERLRISEKIAISSRLHAQASNAPPNGGKYPPQQTHSPVVQAVAATENSNAVLEGKLAAAVPVVGFWGKLSVMLAPFSLTWK